MVRRLCHATCPKDGHWCEQPLPHDVHASGSLCKCAWDDDGNLVVNAATSQLIQIELPDLAEAKNGD